MSQALRSAVCSLRSLQDLDLSEDQRAVLGQVIALAVADEIGRNDRIKALSEAISQHLKAELVVQYGPTGFNTAHMEPGVIAKALQSSPEI